MEILETLKKMGASLYLEDLDFFETELATGGSYNAAYQSECMKIIKELRRLPKHRGAQPTKTAGEDTDEGLPSWLAVDLTKLAPAENNPAASLSPEQLLFREVVQLRGCEDYKAKFKKYIVGQTCVDAAFVEHYFSFFEEWELNAIVSLKPLDEAFLEKYFGALDHDKIARYQQFSEGFFMKHFAQMNPTIVLKHGKNEWRKKENRSSQLDVFLRLKGVKI